MRNRLLLLSLCTGVAFGGYHMNMSYEATAATYEKSGTMRTEKSGDVLASHMTITRGKSKLIRVSDDIADVLVADPSVIEVGAIKKDKLYLIGASLGDTNVMIFDEDGNTIDEMDVHVRVDEVTLQKTLETLFPNEQIVAKTVNDDIMLTGTASNPAIAGRIEEVAARFTGDDEAIVNMMSVLGEQQVMLKVKVMEVTRSVLNELGVSVNAAVNSNDLTSTVFSNQLGLTAPAPLINIGASASLGDIDVGAFFSALERDGYATTLAEPNLTAITGENARFLAGGEFPIPTEIDEDGNVAYTYRPFGVALAFKPVVLSKDRINLNVSTEVSNISNDITVSGGGLTVPGFDVRRAETSVEMPSGGTLMLAGLIESNTLSAMNRVPGIKNVPIIGDLLSSESFQRNETELVVLISSYLVNPVGESQTSVAMTPARQASPLQNAVVRNLQGQYSDANISTITQGAPVGYILD